MRSSNLFQYVRPFFEQLEMFEDVHRGHCYKNYLVSTIEAFLEDETEERAFNVFRAFFDVYRIYVPDNKESFIDIVDVLHQFEEHAALLVDKQRDHLVHSVNVFLTGLAVYGTNQYFKGIFLSTVPEKEYHYSYSTKNEEFFYRWGITSLLHDIGYPIEISYNQINRFLKQTQLQGESAPLSARLELRGFDEYNIILHISPEADFAKVFQDAYPDLLSIDLYKPTDLMAAHLHIHHNVALDTIREALGSHIEKMAESGFVDHGYFSALILLRWYGALIQKNGYKSEYFFWPILDAATAILLHNYYKNGLQKEPFLLGPMSPRSHPIAFLLILCDELQEWNREARGVFTRHSIQTESIQLGNLSDHLYVNFITRYGYLPNEFCKKKKDLLSTLLSMSEIFPEGIDMENTVVGHYFHLETIADYELPRPLLENVEKLAIAIHSRYNDEQLSLHPNLPLRYPSFSDLPSGFQYSNIRQAISIFDKIGLVGYHVIDIKEDAPIVEFPSDVVEFLAQKEHEEWLAEKIESGWKYGPKDDENKRSPFMLPYQELPEDGKELCRASVTDIPILLERIGYRLAKK